MAEKECARCRALNPSQANFCSVCGHSDLRELPPEPSPRPPSPQDLSASNAVQISIGRVLALSVVSLGLYFLYWLFFTWKQLANETQDLHYPVWHALAFLVPVYGLFRIHRHMTVIRDLAVGKGVDTPLEPGLAMVLAGLWWILAFAGVGGLSVSVAILINIVALALIAVLAVWAQATLNRYWWRVKGTDLLEVPFGRMEKVIVAIGLLNWISVILLA